MLNLALIEDLGARFWEPMLDIFTYELINRFQQEGGPGQRSVHNDLLVADNRCWRNI